MEATGSILEISALGASSYFFFDYLRRHLRASSMASFIQNARVFTPSSLENTLKNYNHLDSIKQHLRGFKAKEEHSKAFAFVEGIVASNSYYPSTMDKTRKLVVSKMIAESIFSNVSQTKQTSQLLNESIVSQFDLTEGMASKSRIMLSCSRRVFLDWALEIVGRRISVRRLNVIERFFSILIFCFKLFLAVSNLSKKVTGFRLGTRQVEMGIQLGQSIVAFGEIFYDKLNNEMVMHNPKYLMKHKYQLLSKMRHRKLIYSRNMALAFTVATISSFLILKRIKNGVVNYFERRAAAIHRSINDKLDKTKRLVTAGFCCISCGEQPRNVIFKPCMHMVTC